MMPARVLRAYVRHGPAGRLAAFLAEVLDEHLQHRPIRTITRTRYGARIPVATNDLIQRYLYMFGTWEPNLTAWIRSRRRIQATPSLMSAPTSATSLSSPHHWSAPQAG